MFHGLYILNTVVHFPQQEPTTSYTYLNHQCKEQFQMSFGFLKLYA